MISDFLVCVQVPHEFILFHKAEEAVEAGYALFQRALQDDFGLELSIGVSSLRVVFCTLTSIGALRCALTTAPRFSFR